MRHLRGWPRSGDRANSPAARLNAPPHLYQDRRSAGIELAGMLRAHKFPSEPLVLALPRGGVPVAFEVARALAAPLDILLVRKVGAPGQPELAIGAIATGGIVVREPNASLFARGSTFQHLIEREQDELERRERRYRSGMPALELQRKTVILVDDGIATGATMLAAVRAARAARVARVIVAAPIASPEAAALLRAEADEVLIVQTPAYLASIGEWYRHFEQLEDQDVCTLLQQAHSRGQ